VPNSRHFPTRRAIAEQKKFVAICGNYRPSSSSQGAAPVTSGVSEEAASQADRDTRNLTEPETTSTPSGRAGQRWTSEEARRAGSLGGKATKAARQAAREAAEQAELLAAEGAPGGAVAAAAAVSDPGRRDILAALLRDAKRGDVAAARELREWMRLDPSSGASVEAAQLATLITRLPVSARAALRTVVLDLAREEEPAQEGIREGSDDVDQSPPATESRELEAEGLPPAASESRRADRTESRQR